MVAPAEVRWQLVVKEEASACAPAQVMMMVVVVMMMTMMTPTMSRAVEGGEGPHVCDGLRECL